LCVVADVSKKWFDIAVKAPTYIREVLGSYLGRDTKRSKWDFRDLAQLFLANARKPQLRRGRSIANHFQ
jgi:hypothetical protein